MSSPTLIDDSNYTVQYQSGWNWEPDVSPEVDHTRHWVSVPQVTASLAFIGTGIQVIGTLEPTNQSGQPTTQYAIDGAVVSNYTAPFTPSGSPRYNVTFFSIGGLSQASHEIVITNMNGTSPNTFYLDYFLVYLDSSPSPTTSTPPPTSTKPETSPSTASIPAETSHASSHLSTGAIVGCVIGGVALVVLLAISFAICRRSRRKAIGDIEPFEAAAQGSASSRRTMSLGAGGSPRKSVEIVACSPALVLRPSGGALSSSSGASSVAVTQSEGSVPAQIATVEELPNLSTGPSASPNGQYSSGSTKLPGSASDRSPRSADRRMGAPDDSHVVAPLSSSDSSISSPGASSLQPANLEASHAPWYAPPERLSRAQQILRALSRRRGGVASESDRGVDSGLRLYNEPALPPPYTPD